MGKIGLIIALALSGGCNNNGLSTGADLAMLPGPCPATLPQDSSACSVNGLSCEYGDDPRGDACRPTAHCLNGSWSAQDPMCPPPPSATCPPTRAAAAGNACTPDGAFCGYDGLSCQCTNCTDGPVTMCSGPTTWHCQAPNPDPTCPAAKPNLGVGCGGAAQTCVYACGTDGARACSGGVWTATSGGPCPVSTRLAKTDIRYLSAEELARAASELQSLRLATWRYTDPALARGRRLGFIIEDSPGSAAVDGQHNMVDLYGFASLLAAAVQTQSKEITSLRREVNRLKAQLATRKPQTDSR